MNGVQQILSMVMEKEVGEGGWVVFFVFFFPACQLRVVPLLRHSKIKPVLSRV